jgi:hypothetical protein
VGEEESTGAARAAPEAAVAVKRFLVLAACLTAVATGAAVGLTLGITPATGRDWLILLGGSYEVASVLLIASPELWPRAVWLASRLRLIASTTAQALVQAGRRLLGRPSNVTIPVPVAATLSLGGHGTHRVSTAATTLEEKIEYLLRRDQDVQARFDEVADRVTAAEKALRDEIANLARDQTAELERTIRAVQDAYIDVRLVGVLILIAGIILSVSGSLS